MAILFGLKHSIESWAEPVKRSGVWAVLVTGDKGLGFGFLREGVELNTTSCSLLDMV